MHYQHPFLLLAVLILPIQSVPTNQVGKNCKLPLTEAAVEKLLANIQTFKNNTISEFDNAPSIVHHCSTSDESKATNAVWKKFDEVYKKIKESKNNATMMVKRALNLINIDVNFYIFYDPSNRYQMLITPNILNLNVAVLQNSFKKYGFNFTSKKRVHILDKEAWGMDRNSDYFNDLVDCYGDKTKATTLDVFLTSITSKKKNVTILGVPMYLNSLILGFYGGDIEKSDAISLNIFGLKGVKGHPYNNKNVDPFEGLRTGMTLVHEVGHWLGLKHPFHQGCSYGESSITDIRPCLRPTGDAEDCPADAKLSCPDSAFNTKKDKILFEKYGKGLKEPLNNIMNYVNDHCLTEFSPEQVKKMHAYYNFRLAYKRENYFDVD